MQEASTFWLCLATIGVVIATVVDQVKPDGLTWALGGTGVIIAISIIMAVLWFGYIPMWWRKFRGWARVQRLRIAAMLPA